MDGNATNVTSAKTEARTCNFGCTPHSATSTRKIKQLYHFLRRTHTHPERRIILYQLYKNQSDLIHGQVDETRS